MGDNEGTTGTTNTLEFKDTLFTVEYFNNNDNSTVITNFLNEKLVLSDSDSESENKTLTLTLEPLNESDQIKNVKQVIEKAKLDNFLILLRQIFDKYQVEKITEKIEISFNPNSFEKGNVKTEVKNKQLNIILEILIPKIYHLIKIINIINTSPKNSNKDVNEEFKKILVYLINIIYVIIIILNYHLEIIKKYIVKVADVNNGKIQELIKALNDKDKIKNKEEILKKLKIQYENSGSNLTFKELTNQFIIQDGGEDIDYFENQDFQNTSKYAITFDDTIKSYEKALELFLNQTYNITGAIKKAVIEVLSPKTIEGLKLKTLKNKEQQLNYLGNDLITQLAKQRTALQLPASTSAQVQGQASVQTSTGGGLKLNVLEKSEKADTQIQNFISNINESLENTSASTSASASGGSNKKRKSKNSKNSNKIKNSNKSKNSNKTKKTSKHNKNKQTGGFVRGGILFPESFYIQN